MIDLPTLLSLYGEVGEASRVKETDRLTAEYRAFIEASPFAILATAGADGLDASPRGDTAGFIRVADDRTLLLPDRRGNNRIDSSKNILHDPHVALIFLIPGIGETLRVNGRATISIDAGLRESFAVDGKPPQTVLVITIDSVFFQCSRAVVRADLWNADKHAKRNGVPSAGQMLASVSNGCAGGESYDKALPDRVRGSLY